MNRHAIRFAFLAVAVLVVPLLRADVDAAPKQIVIEARFLETADYGFTESIGHYPLLQFDTSNGMKFKTKKKFRKNGVKHRGLWMKAKQDAAGGFASLGQQFSVENPITIEATLQLQTTKGMRSGSVFGIEFDSPFVPIGGQFDNFLFVGASYESGGLQGFTSLNGTNVGVFPLFPDAMSIDVQTQFTETGVTVDMKPSEESTWTNLVTDLEFDRLESIGVGIGMSNVDKGAKMIAGCIRVDGPLIYARPALTPLLGTVDAIRDNLAAAHDLMTHEDGNGDPDPDILGAENHLNLANDLRVQLITDFEASWGAGDLDPNTPQEDVLKKLDKAGRKLVPVLDRIPDVGKLFKSSDEKRVRKTELLIYVAAKIMTIGEED